MPITIPTIAEIRDQIISDIETKIGASIPIAPKAFVRVLAVALAGVQGLAYRFGKWIYQQIFPQTADEEALARIGDQYAISRIPAMRAQLTADATGDEDTELPAGTLWRGPNDLVYSQAATVVIPEAGTVEIAVECLTAGEDGNLEIGEILNLVTPIPGATGEATVNATVVTGEDQEDIEDYRDRILIRLRNRPQGGAAPDWVLWTREVPGIVKAFAFRTAPGTVTAYPLVAVTGDSRLPGAPKIAEVLAYLDDTALRPLCADVLVVAMTERSFTVKITGLQPNTQEVKDAITAAYQTYLWSRYPKQYPNEINPVDIVSAAALYGVAFEAGADQLTLELYINGNPSPIAAHILASNEIARLQEIQWL